MSVSQLGPQFTVITQHGEDRKVRRKTFPDYDAALAHAQSSTPDTDSSMVPTLDEPHASHPDYERGVFWEGNKYAVITKKGNRNLR